MSSNGAHSFTTFKFLRPRLNGKRHTLVPLATMAALAACSGGKDPKFTSTPHGNAALGQTTETEATAPTLNTASEGGDTSQAEATIQEVSAAPQPEPQFESITDEQTKARLQNNLLAIATDVLGAEHAAQMSALWTSAGETHDEPPNPSGVALQLQGLTDPAVVNDLKDFAFSLTMQQELEDLSVSSDSSDDLAEVEGQ